MSRAMNVTPDDVKITVGTDLGRDVIVATIEVAETVWAEIVAEDPGFAVTFFQGPDGDFLTVSLGVALEALEHARLRLERMGFRHNAARDVGA